LDARVQTPRPDNPADASIGDLFHQLADDGKSYARAEVNLYKQIARYRVGKARNGLIALAATWFLMNAALIAFFVGLVMGLADLIGPVAGGIAVLVITGILGYFLVRYGIGKLSALSGDAEETAALRTGEQRA
jgi:predicted PurR-regulated permease PerM